jgi:50S ribosomal protein L16 3-hydroxylase
VSNPFNTEEFLSQYWQQSPLLIRKAFDLEGLISADELAGLAMEPEVESRIIHGSFGDNEWHLKHGPFAEQDFSQLPTQNWTLLVQAVDHWLAEVREVLKQFSFLPQWRIDDIMISFATDGGGVGPHFDQYDVFLIQLEGQRRWRTGQLCDENSDLIDQMPVKVLSQFEEQENWILEPGDTLYLPPGLAHWGTSVGDSMTLSVGFRAPAESEFVSDFGHFLSSEISDFIRYHDSKLENRQNNSHEIMTSDIGRLQAILKKYSEEPKYLTQWLGQYMTEPKYADGAVDTGDWTFESFLTHWKNHPLFRNASSRMAYGANSLFVDGQTIKCQLTTEELNLLCDSEVFDYNHSVKTESKEFQRILWSLLNVGVVFFEE